jgi:predicted peptidase
MMLMNRRAVWFRGGGLAVLFVISWSVMGMAQGQTSGGPTSGDGPEWQALYVEGEWPTEVPGQEQIDGGDERLRLPFRVMMPEGVESKQREGEVFPLVVFLHGAGERGTDNGLQLKHGLREIARPSRRESFPAFVIAPQCPEGKRWVEVDWTESAGAGTWPKEPGEVMVALLELVEQFAATHPVDRERIYLTGLSMGGYGSWYAAATRPDWFAAVAPVCGGGDPTWAERLKGVPIWTFHGAVDPVVPVIRSREMIEAIEKVGGSVKYTEYPQVDHFSWGPAYEDESLYQWMFAQRRTATSSAESKPSK